jgi:hypothetical protein
MTAISRVLVLLLAIALVLVGGCKKTVEGEQKAYEANVAEIGALKATYPGFASVLDARLEKAKGIYEASSSLSGDAQIEKLSEANAALSGGFVSELRAIEKKIDELRKKRVEAAAKAGDESSRLAAKVAADDAEKTLERVEETLKNGASDEGGATAVVGKVKADVDTALAAVTKVLESDKEKKDAQKAAADEKAAKEAKDKADADAKVADWKCEYCGTSNKHDAKTCESCGAPRK